jgi:hypothetical protein
MAAVAKRAHHVVNHHVDGYNHLAAHAPLPLQVVSSSNPIFGGRRVGGN